MAMAACMVQADGETPERSNVVCSRDVDYPFIDSLQVDFEKELGEDFTEFSMTYCKYWQYETYRTYTVKVAYQPSSQEYIHASLNVYDDDDKEPVFNCAEDGQ